MRKNMDKSPSINCQEIDDGSWDLDENENNEELLRSLENLSSNSWDSSSEKEDKSSGHKCDGAGDGVTVVEAFEAGERGKETTKPERASTDSWRSSGSRKRVIRAMERPPFELSDSTSSSNSLDEVICLPEVLDGDKLEVEDEEEAADECGIVQKFAVSPVFQNDQDEDVCEIVEDVIELKNVEDEPLSKNENVELFLSKRDDKEEQFLVVEDLEEPEKSEPEEQCQVEAVEDVESDEVCDSVNSLPKISPSGPTSSSDDSDSVYNLVRNLKSGRLIRKKSNSDRSAVKVKKNPKKSKSSGDVTATGEFSLKDALVQFEGSQVQAVKEKKEKDNPDGPDILDVCNLGEGPNHFQEIECRTLRAIITNVKAESMEMEREEAKEEQTSECGTRTGRNHPGTSGNVSEEAVSLPDIAGAGRSEMKPNPQFRKTVSYTTNQNLVREVSSKTMDHLSESWILLDEMGQSQPVTLREVNFLLNGRSADTVLQENKEHFIPKSTVVRNVNSDLRVDQWNPLVEESLQHFLNEEDPAGEESASKSIGLERKFGNMLLYIQSGVNLTSSVRFIPIDTEMIHMWRQSKENVSPISSEDDARVAVSENITEETSEYDNPETPDDVRCRIHEPYKSGATMRKRRMRQNKSDDCDHRMVEDRMIIESLTDDIKQLRMRLEAERCRSSGLEQEIYRLRDQLDKYKSGQSSSESQKTKSGFTDGYKGSDRNDPVFIPEITSSSLLSIDEFRHESGGKGKMENPSKSCSDIQKDSRGFDEEPKNFKEALDRNLNDIEEILMCKNRAQGKTSKDSSERANSNKPVRFTEDNSRMSSSVSVNTYAVLETTSQVLTETTGSEDSLFKQLKQDSSQKNISDIINDLEKENEKLVMENLNLKKKLNDISLELDEYISSCVAASPVDDARQTESLRNQVCNLKLELENLKSLAKNKEHSCRIKDAIFREQLAEKSVSLEEWRSSILDIFRDIDQSREKLSEIGFPTIPNICSEIGRLPPNDLLSHLRSLMTKLMSLIVDAQKENTFLRKSLQEKFVCNSTLVEKSFDVNFLPEVPGLFIRNVPNEKEEYHTLLLDKTTLEEEIRNLRKENDLLLEYQISHNENMKKSTIALREEKAKVDALDKKVRILEIEKAEMSETMISYQKERSIAESELKMERSKLAEFKVDHDRMRHRVKELEEKLSEATEKSRTYGQAVSLKEEVISQLKSSCNELESRESVQSQQIQYLTEQVKKLEDEKSELEEELTSTKHIAEESSRGMSDYISHLETMVANSEDSLSQLKEKLNETCKSFATLKKEHEELEKQSANSSKMLHKTRDELDNCKGIIRDLEESNRRSEEAKRMVLGDLNKIVKSEREKTETLEKMIAERKMIDEEVSALKLRVETHAKRKDQLMKEHKDFMNEISILKKENNRLAHKYRNVKSECNERTKLLKRLDGRLKENLMEYNRRLACLEKNVSNVIEKAEAYKDTFLEKRTEVNAVVRELQEHLDTVYMEKKGLENEAANFYAAMKHLQKEVNERRRSRRLSFVLDKERQRTDGSRANAEDTSDVSASNGNDEADDRLKQTEVDLADAKEKIEQLETSKEDERKKYETIIADLKSQISRYQVRLEVMINNISTYGRAQDDKKDVEGAPKIALLEQKIRELTEELEKKRKRMVELTEVIENNEAVIQKKGEECEALNQKVIQLKEEIKSMRSQFTKLQEFLSTVGRNVETYQKERDEIAGKLAESLKVIVEEKASKQSSETVFAEKEKLFKDQLEQLQARLADKKKDHETLAKTVEEKKVLIAKLQEEVKKWKSEVAILKSQVTALKGLESREDGGEKVVELREVRASNLELRKRERALETNLVRLEDELREAKLLIRELEGDVRAEKTSKKLLKEMITAAKEDIEKFKLKGHIMGSIADKIERHFNLSEVQSRELFSGFRAGGDEQKCSLLHNLD